MAGQLSGQGPQPHHTGVQCSAWSGCGLGYVPAGTSFGGVS